MLFCVLQITFQNRTKNWWRNFIIEERGVSLPISFSCLVPASKLLSSTFSLQSHIFKQGAINQEGRVAATSSVLCESTGKLSLGTVGPWLEWHEYKQLTSRGLQENGKGDPFATQATSARDADGNNIFSVPTNSVLLNWTYRSSILAVVYYNHSFSFFSPKPVIS